MRYWPYLLSGVTLAGGGLILLVSGPFSIELPFTPLLFCLSMSAAVVGAGALCRGRHWLSVALVLALTVSLFVLSFGEWYIEHWVPGPAGYTVHRHTLWEIGHVH
jgi:hypothetical protein